MVLFHLILCPFIKTKIVIRIYKCICHFLRICIFVTNVFATTACMICCSKRTRARKRYPLPEWFVSYDRSAKRVIRDIQNNTVKHVRNKIEVQWKKDTLRSRYLHQRVEESKQLLNML